MTQLQTALFVGLLFGLIAGIYIARISAQHEKIYGGTLAHIVHYLGAAILIAVPPTVITSLIIGGGLGLAIPLAIGLFASGFLVLLVFATVEYPARPQTVEDHGWTEQDARTSGL